jgi:hypothetical protein
MITMFSREQRRQGIEAKFADPAAITDTLGDVDVPADIAAWLGRLLTLAGVPFGYLVPDERMLPPESIRFFRLDENWVRVLLDGAFSLGRNLTAEASSPSAALDSALIEPVAAQARAAAPLRRRAGAAVPVTGSSAFVPSPASAATAATPLAWTGFLLRSLVVAECPGLGVNVYPQGGTPDDPAPVLLPVRRLDRLGSGGDTLLCLVEGDAYRVDLHEAPELLHYGIDQYQPPAGSGAPTASKNLHTFTVGPNGAITLSAGHIVPVGLGPSFRTRSPRVLRLDSLAAAIAAANNLTTVDAAQMGFEMTEGVGMVSFINRDAQ